MPLALLQVVAVVGLALGFIRPFYASHTGVFADDAGHIVLVGIGRSDGLHDVLGVWTAPVFITVSIVGLWLARRASLALARRRLERKR